MRLLIMILLLLPLKINAWTLSSSARAGFQTSTAVDIYISSDSCTNAGLTSASLQSIASDAISKFWNKVSTTALKLSIKGVSNISLSGDDLTSAANKTAVNSIIIGCNQNATLFSANNILAVGGIGCAGTNCMGAVIINDISGTSMGQASRDTQVSTLAHELGHALGLGHSSVQEALMYYSASGAVNKSLHQDDIDGISYLYPNEKKLSGLAGACASVDIDKNHNGDFLISLIGGIFLVVIAHFFSKRNTYVTH